MKRYWRDRLTYLNTADAHCSHFDNLLHQNPELQLMYFPAAVFNFQYTHLYNFGRWYWYFVFWHFHFSKYNQYARNIFIEPSVSVNSLGQVLSGSSGVDKLTFQKGKCAQCPDWYREDFIYPDSNLVYPAVTASHGHYASECCIFHLFKPGLMVRYHSGGMRQITRVVR